MSVGITIKARTIATWIIARIIKVLTELRSEPNMIGIGPMRRIPALLVWPLEPRDFTARSIAATKAKRNPTATSNNPAFVRNGSAKLSPPIENPRFPEL
jgi:hypothetical protein